MWNRITRIPLRVIYEVNSFYLRDIFKAWMQQLKKVEKFQLRFNVSERKNMKQLGSGRRLSYLIIIASSILLLPNSLLQVWRLTFWKERKGEEEESRVTGNADQIETIEKDNAVRASCKARPMILCTLPHTAEEEEEEEGRYRFAPSSQSSVNTTTTTTTKEKDDNDMKRVVELWPFVSLFNSVMKWQTDGH